MCLRFEKNVPLAPFCSYRIGGKAKCLVTAFDVDGLLRAMELSSDKIVLGKGSKVLVSDAGFDGTVILMRCGGVRQSDGVVYAEAGVDLPYLCKLYAERGLGGLEWASGIPASVGGAVRQNAGAHGGDMAGIVLYADVLRGGKIVRLPQSECGFAYRHSGFFPDDVIVGAGMKAEAGDSAAIAAATKEFARRRAEAQPSGFSCGSVFKGGEKPAYAYIEECGLKGLTCGGAEISKKHCNFIVNKGGATARDVYTLIRTVKAEVFCRLGVKLREEVVFVGEF